jgi:hypothetical protein
VIDCKNDMKSLGVRPEIFPAYQVTGESVQVSPAMGESGTGESIREWVSPAIGESTTKESGQ